MSDFGIDFLISFHSPFRILTGEDAELLDGVVDPENLIPAPSLKGLMRSSAVRLVGQQSLIDQVFGRGGDEGEWAWERAEVHEWEIRERTRIAIDSRTRTVKERHLQTAELVYARTAKFKVEYLSGSTPSKDQEMLVCASARGIHSIGADRNRGFGWVQITTASGEPSVDDLVSSIMGMRKTSESIPFATVGA